MTTLSLRLLTLVPLMLVGCTDSPIAPPAVDDPPLPTTVPSATSLSGSGRIAFVSTRGDGESRIYLVGADGTGLTRLVPGTNPSWSPDGRTLAYQGWSGSEYEVRVIDADGDRLLVGGMAHGPSWSHDGTAVVFGREGEIFAIDVDGTDERKLIGFDALTAWTGFGESPNDTRYMWSPTWSPDGRYLAVVAFGREGGDPVILVTDAAGTGLVPGSPLLRAAHASGGVDWSPDGSRLLFNRYAGSGVTQVVSVGVESWDEQILPVNGATPRWSPDGATVILTTPMPWACQGEPCDARIWVADPVTGRGVQVVPDDPDSSGKYTDTDAAWARPNG